MAKGTKYINTRYIKLAVFIFLSSFLFVGILEIGLRILFPNIAEGSKVNSLLISLSRLSRTYLNMKLVIDKQMLKFPCGIEGGWQNVKASIITEKKDHIDNQPGNRFLRMRELLNSTHVRTNNFGYRDSNFYENENFNYKIACIGDSITFGFGVNEEDSFPKIVESYLRNRYGKESIRVYNMGIPGKSSLGGKLLLMEDALKFKPNLVVVQFALNDINYDITENSIRNPSNILLQKLRLLLSNSAIIACIAQYTDPKSIKSVNNKNKIFSAYSFKDNIRYIINKSRENGAKVILLTTYVPFNFDLLYEYNDSILSLCDEDNEIKCLNLKEDFESQPISEQSLKEFDEGDNWIKDIGKLAGMELKSSNFKETRLFYFELFHPNAEGHNIIAKSLINSITKSKTYLNE